MTRITISFRTNVSHVSMNLPCNPFGARGVVTRNGPRHGSMTTEPDFSTAASYVLQKMRSYIGGWPNVLPHP